MALRTADDDPNKNIGQRHSDNQFNALKKAESAGTTDSSIKDSNAGSENINNAEENPSGDWQNNVSGTKPSLSKSGGRFGFIKKKGPLAAIVLTLVGGGLGIGGLLSPALIGPTILANLIQKFNGAQETSAFFRTNAIVKAMSNEATSGYCGKVTFLCKLTRPSNYFLTKLNANGIQALDSKGKAITKNTFLPNGRPAKYSYKNGAGETIEVEAKDLYKTLVNDSKFRASFNGASMSRFMTVVDSVFSKIKVKFDFKTTDKLSGIDSEENLASKLDDEVPINSEMKAAAEGVIGKEEENIAKKLIQDEANSSIEKLGKAGKASVVNLVAGGVCLVTDIPGLISKANRTFQMGQFVKYSMVFLSAFGAIKAGDATPEETAAIGNILTQQDKNGKTAMDSFGMKYAINGDTKPTNNNYKNFAPGGNINPLLNSVTKKTNSSAKKTTCKVAMDPRTGVAIDVALAESGIGIFPLFANIAAGFVLSEIAVKVVPYILDPLISLIPVDKILLAFIGDQTQGISGENVGDALTSGASHVMGQSANAGGNMPLTVEDAVAYKGLSKQIQIAYAEEDRATLSLFDISSPNTMLGSIVQKLIPYYASASSTAGSITHSLSFISNTIIGSFSAALQPLKVGAATTKDDYSCDDPAIEDTDLAIGPYCNLEYGVPVQYLDEDPVKVVEKLIADDEIDEITGDPIADSGLSIWTSTCTDGAVALAEECKITDKTAYYSLYTIDHRVQTYMEGPAVTTTTTEGAAL